jgi:hypothetical protein
MALAAGTLSFGGARSQAPSDPSKTTARAGVTVVAESRAEARRADGVRPELRPLHEGVARVMRIVPLPLPGGTVSSFGLTDTPDPTSFTQGDPEAKSDGDRTEEYEDAANEGREDNGSSSYSPRP